MQSSRSIHSFASWNRPAMTWKSFTSFSTFVSDRVFQEPKIESSTVLETFTLFGYLFPNEWLIVHTVYTRSSGNNASITNNSIRPFAFFSISFLPGPSVPSPRWPPLVCLTTPSKYLILSFELLFSSPASGSIFLIIKLFAMSQSTPSPSDPTFPSDRPEFRKWSYFTPPSHSPP